MEAISNETRKGRNGWRCETIYAMEGNRQLSITTAKGQSGLCTSVTSHIVEKHEGYETHSFGMYSDYSRVVARSGAKCTEKAVIAMHAETVVKAAEYLEHAREFYRVKAAHPDLVSDRQVFAKMGELTVPATV